MRIGRIRRTATALVALTCTMVMCLGGVATAVGNDPSPGGENPAVAQSVTSSPMSTASAIDILASNGIATVATESTTTPLHAVTGPVVLRLTEAQVAGMAAGATNHAGMLGASLDTIVPGTKGTPPFSYLLAAWLSTGKSGGAAVVRANMGTQVWSNAPALVFPTIALSLFAADSIKALDVTSSASNVQRADANASDATPMIAVAAPCSLVSNFLKQVLDAVFDNLKLNSPTGGTVTAKIGGFFVNLWNTAVSYAKSAVSGLASAALNIIVGKIAAAAAAAATIAEVVSNIAPWSVRVAAVPASVDYGSSGTFNAIASSGGGVDYPPAVQDCAQKLNITLPTLSAKGATGTWTVVGPLSPTSATSVILGTGGANTLNYETTKSSSTCAVVPEEIGQATITITRPAVDHLKGLVDTWLTSLLSAAGQSSSRCSTPSSTVCRPSSKASHR